MGKSAAQEILLDHNGPFPGETLPGDPPGWLAADHGHTVWLLARIELRPVRMAFLVAGAVGRETGLARLLSVRVRVGILRVKAICKRMTRTIV